MIQTIGLMIGAYVVARMLDLAMTATVHGFVRAFAILTALFELLLIAILLASGSDPSSFRPR